MSTNNKFTKLETTIPVAEIGNALTSISDDHILGTAGDIYDTDFHEGAYQSEINRYLDNNFSGYLPLTGGEINGQLTVKEVYNVETDECSDITFEYEEYNNTGDTGKKGYTKINRNGVHVKTEYIEHNVKIKDDYAYLAPQKFGVSSDSYNTDTGELNRNASVYFDTYSGDNGEPALSIYEQKIDGDNTYEDLAQLTSKRLKLLSGTEDDKYVIDIQTEDTARISVSNEMPNETYKTELDYSGYTSSIYVQDEQGLSRTQNAVNVSSMGIYLSDSNFGDSLLQADKWELQDTDGNTCTELTQGGLILSGVDPFVELVESGDDYYVYTVNYPGASYIERNDNENLNTLYLQSDEIKLEHWNTVTNEGYSSGITAEGLMHPLTVLYRDVENNPVEFEYKAGNPVEGDINTPEVPGNNLNTIDLSRGVYYATTSKTATRVSNELTIRTGEGEDDVIVYNGQEKQEINISPEGIGAAPTDHNHDTVYSKLEHNHDDTYADIEHHHDDEYSKLGHEHNYAGSKTKGGAANQVENKLTLNVNGTNTEFDGSAAKTVSINASSIGAAPTNHNHDTYADIEHHHDTVYSKLGHNHDAVYAKKDWVTEELSYKLGAMEKAVDSYRADIAENATHADEATTANIANELYNSIQFIEYNKTTSFNGSESVDIDLRNTFNVTYSELVELKNNSSLKPGTKYRITDYSTIVEKAEITSAGHDFDIVVEALDENTLSEIAYAKCSSNITYIEGNKIGKCVYWDNDFYYLYNNWQIWNKNDMPYALKQVIPSNAVVRRNIASNNTSTIISLPKGRVKIKIAVRNHRNKGYNSALTYAATCYGVDICPDTLNDTNSDTWTNDIVAYDYHAKTYVFDKEHNNVSDTEFEYILNVPEAGNYKLCVIVDDTDDVFMNNSKDNRVELGVYGETYELTEQLNTYFNNCNLNAWELKYCLDNDTNRFDWANSSGKGVIYYMKDEHDNIAPYDFKNILINGLYTFNYQINGISYDGSVKYGNKCFGNKLCSDSTDESGTNKPGLPKIIFKNTSENALCKYNVLSNNAWNISFGSGCYYNEFIGKCENISLGNDCFMNVFHEDCTDNTLKDGCTNNTFGNSCTNNKLGFRCSHNIFGNNCSNNNFYEAEGSSHNTFGNICFGNTFKGECGFNKFGDYCQNNILRSCTNNIFGYKCTNNKFANGCSNNKLSSNCTNNSFGTNCKFNELSDFCNENIIGCTSSWSYPDISQVSEGECTNNILGYKCTKICLRPKCNYNTFGSCCGIYVNTANNTFDNIGMKLDSDCESNSFGIYCAGNQFGSNCSYNTFGDYSSYNTFGSYCQSNNIGISVTSCSFGDYMLRCKVGNKCTGCKISKESASEGVTTTLLDCIKLIEFGNECNNVNLYVNSTSTSSYLQNYKVANGLTGNIAITGNSPRGRNYTTTIAKDSTGAIVQRCIEDNCHTYTINTTYSSGKLTVSLS